MLQPERDPALSPLLEAFRIQGKVLDPNVESNYPDITGYIHGDVETSGEFNLTGIPSRLGSWNWKATTKSRRV